MESEELNAIPKKCDEEAALEGKRIRESATDAYVATAAPPGSLHSPPPNAVELGDACADFYYKPGMIWPDCGDVMLNDLRWESWTTSQAIATGVLCPSTCPAGARSVRVILSQPEAGNFRRLTALDEAGKKSEWSL